MSHTPGPWQVVISRDETGYPYFALCGLAGDAKRDIPTLFANANLIGSAPDLLAALKALWEWAGTSPDIYADVELGRRCANAQKAIAKAEGR